MPGPKPTLCYFDGRGLAETARQMLTIAGVEFTDNRYNITMTDGNFSAPEMDADKETGRFDANLGRLPVLEVDGFSIGGSKAVNRYIAQAYGLNGRDAKEAAIIDTICEIVNDIGDAFNKAEDKDKWFSASSKVAYKQGERQLQWYVENLEKLLGDDGFAVGDKFSMADAVIYARFGEAATTKGLFGSTDSQPMSNGAEVAKVLANNAPKLNKIVNNWRNNSAIQKYLQERPVPLF